MNGRGHRKQILLFLLTVLLPSAVLIVLTLRTIGQEKELAQKRTTEERRRVAWEIGQHVLVRLEGIKVQEVGALSQRQLVSAAPDYVNPETTLICRVEGRRLILPWEGSQGITNADRHLNEPEYASRIRQAEREEFAQNNSARAAGVYRRAMDAAEEPIQREYAKLMLARTLAKSSREADALELYKEISSLPFTLSDEYGIPLSLYAASRLLEHEDGCAEVLEHIQKELQKNHWLSPSGSYFLKDQLDDTLAERSGQAIRSTAEACQGLIEGHIRRVEQALALQNDYLSLGLSQNSHTQSTREHPLWILYGRSPWLVSLSATISESPPLLVAVSAPEVLTSLQSEGDFRETFPCEFRLVPEAEPEAWPLGPNLQGLGIAFTGDPENMFSPPWNIRPAFYLLALALILGVTLFGAYLLWRDVRREVQMAEMRSQFVSSVSHELKTPLTAIRMFAETLRLGRSKDRETQTEYLDTIVNESRRLTRLLNNVLDFSKIEQGKRLYRPEPASLYEIVSSAARAMEYPLSQQGFILDVQAEEGIPEVRVDSDAIEQALLNLLHNAMKYSGESREIGLYMKRVNGQALIQVVDKGIGIDTLEQKRIFEKFYRVPSPENQRIVGTGLGLALVSHIVEAHGGRLDLQSEPGRGSTFSIFLPLENEA